MVLTNNIGAAISLIVSVMKSIYIAPDLSLWFLTQLLVWGAVVFALVRYLLSALAGQGGE